MHAPSILRPLALLSLLALTAAPSLGNAASAWPTSPLYLYPIAPNPSADQVMCGMLPDGAGGAFALWSDKRGGTDDVYLQRVTATGQISAGWPATGFQVCTFSSQRLEPQMISDGATGVIVVWVDKRSGNGDIFAQRVLGNATLAGGSWPANGLQLTANALTDRRPMICSDGAGGVLAAWELTFSATDTDVYGAHVTQSGSLTFSQAFDAAVNNSRSISVTSDNAGGFYVAYQDSSSAFSAHPQIYGMRLNGAGSVLVAKTGLSVAGSFYDSINPHLAPDGAGGFYAVWMANDIHTFYDLEGERYGSNLAIYPPWVTFGGSNLTFNSNGLGYADFNVIPDGLNGIFFSYNLNGFSWLGHAGPTRPTFIGWPVNIGQDQRIGSLAADGSHGAIVVHQGADNGVYAQRVAPDGTIVARWGTGVGLHTNSHLDLNMFAVPDLNHGAIAGWSNYAFPSLIPNVCAQRVDRFGALGNPEPAITSIADVAGDQGGHVRLAWNGSYLDADPYYAISSYYVWRQTPLSSASAAVKLGAKWADDAGATLNAAPGRIFRHDASNAFAWEFIASQPTNGSSQYTYTAATTRDSMGVSNPRTAFMVEARWAGGAAAFWDSAPDSGYSVDNLGPAAPVQFTGQYATGTTHLHWMPNLEADLAGYRLYRGTTASFTPGVSNNVASPPDTGYVDAAGAAYYYKLSAVDIHGNESPYVTLLPQGVAGVDVGTPAPKLAIAVVSANPMSREAKLRFDLTRQGSVRITIYNVAGQMVREVVGGDFPPGQWFANWNGLENGGVTAPSGLYFVRLEAEGTTLTRKLVLER